MGALLGGDSVSVRARLLIYSPIHYASISDVMPTPTGANSSSRASSAINSRDLDVDKAR